MQKIIKNGHGIGFWMVTSYAGLIIVHTIDLISLTCLKLADVAWNINDVFSVIKNVI